MGDRLGTPDVVGISLLKFDFIVYPLPSIRKELHSLLHVQQNDVYLFLYFTWKTESVRENDIFLRQTNVVFLHIKVLYIKVILFSFVHLCRPPLTSLFLFIHLFVVLLSVCLPAGPRRVAMFINLSIAVCKV